MTYIHSYTNGNTIDILDSLRTHIHIHTYIYIYTRVCIYRQTNQPTPIPPPTFIQNDNAPDFDYCKLSIKQLRLDTQSLACYERRPICQEPPQST